MEDKANKFDQGKPRFSLIPRMALLEVAKVHTHGAEKYGEFNYSGEMSLLRYTDALERHLNQWYLGEDYDKDSKVHHLAAVAANALMALDAILTGKGIDTRNKVYKEGNKKDEENNEI